MVEIATTVEIAAVTTSGRSLAMTDEALRMCQTHKSHRVEFVLDGTATLPATPLAQVSPEKARLNPRSRAET